MKAQKTFDSLERKRSNYELYREASRCQNEETIPNFILQKLDYKCLVTSNQGKCSLLDRSTQREIEQPYSTLTRESCRLGVIIVNLYVGLDGSRQLDFLKIDESELSVTQLPGCPISLTGFEPPNATTVCVDDSTVARINETVYFILPMYWRQLEIDDDFHIDIAMNKLIYTFVADSSVKQCYFEPNEMLPLNELPYSQCVIGKYLFIETSVQSSARLRIKVRVYKMDTDDLIWRRIHLSPEFESFLTAKSMSIAPQRLRSDPDKLIYLQEHVANQHSISRSVRIYVLDFKNDLIKRIFKYDYDDEFRQCYLSGNNFVVHSGSWFYSPQCRIHVWNLKSILSGTRSEPPTLPDFTIDVEDDIVDNCYAIISDSGIMVRNVHTFNFDYYHDFVPKWPVDTRTLK